MRLQITTDYAIRIMLFMASQAGTVSTAEVASKELGITHGYFIKVAHKLKSAGLLASVQGPGGGYYIAKGAIETTLYDIVQAMEGAICINRCMAGDGFCSRNATLTCPVHRTFEKVQNQIIDTLKSVKICDLCDSDSPDLIPEAAAYKNKIIAFF